MNKAKIIFASCFIAAILIGTVVEAQFMPGEVVPTPQTTLDAYFTTGAVPGQLQYWSLIDTMFYYVAATYTNSVAAAQSAAQAQILNANKLAVLEFSFSGSSVTPPKITFLSTNGFSSNAINSFNSGSVATGKVTNYFTASIANFPQCYYTVSETPGYGNEGTNNHVLSADLETSFFSWTISTAATATNYYTVIIYQ